MPVSCGNEGHPDGMWHPCEPVPFYSVWPPYWKAQFLYWWRTKRWGCGCPKAAQ